MNIYLIFICFNILNISAYYIKHLKQYPNNRLNLLKYTAVPENKHFDIFNNKEQLLRYITSFRDYTIITDGDKAKDLFAKMEKKKYNTNNSGENIWVFKREFLIGSGEDALKLISKI